MSTRPAPNPVRVKVCGIRDPGEALALDALGVDWLGFNFHPGSKRYIAPEDAAPIIARLRHAVAVGVFVDADAEHVRAVTERTGIRLAQLHGAEGWDRILSSPVPVIKAVPHTRLGDLQGLAGEGPWAAPGADPAPLEYLLVDTQAKPAPGAGAGAFGGSGEAFDWDLLRARALPLPLFLAGGLGPHNLRAAVAACAPFAVDLNSQVETAPGRKDVAKVEACLALLAGA